MEVVFLACITCSPISQFSSTNSRAVACTSYCKALSPFGLSEFANNCAELKMGFVSESSFVFVLGGGGGRG